VSRDLEGEAVILNLESGTYFGPDKVGTQIWTLLQEDGSLRRAFEAVGCCDSWSIASLISTCTSRPMRHGSQYWSE
jgi:hypothetical protein